MSVYCFGSLPNLSNVHTAPAPLGKGSIKVTTLAYYARLSCAKCCQWPKLQKVTHRTIEINWTRLHWMI